VFRDCQVDSSVYLGVTNIIVRRKPLQPMIPRMVDERRIWSIAHEPEMLLLPSGKGLIGIFVASQCSILPFHLNLPSESSPLSKHEQPPQRLRLTTLPWGLFSETTEAQLRAGSDEYKTACL